MQHPLKTHAVRPSTKLPVTERHSTTKHHQKFVTALCYDNAGTRLYSGSYDYSIKLWDFNTMDLRFQPLRTITPWEGYHIRKLQFDSHSNDRFLVVAGASSCKLLDREGSEVQEYQHGDPYIKDLRKTSGHVAGLTGCQWHPIDQQLFLTCSEDGTVRVWDVDKKRKQLEVLQHKSATRRMNGRLDNAVSAACFVGDGKQIVAIGRNGAISVWNWKTPHMRPQIQRDDAYKCGSWPSSIIAVDNIIITRGGGDFDVCMRWWDMRNMKIAVHDLPLPNDHQETNLTLVDNLIMTGTSATVRNGESSLNFYNASTADLVDKVQFTGTNVISSAYCQRTHQIAVGCSDGTVTFLHGEGSKRGVLTSLARQVKRKQDDSTALISNKIYVPDEDGNFREDEDDWRQVRQKQRRDPVLTKRPPKHDPMAVPLPKAPNALQQVLVMDSKDTSLEEDPRAAILRHAEAAAKDPKYVDHAYKETQPHTIYDTSKRSDDEEDD